MNLMLVPAKETLTVFRHTNSRTPHADFLNGPHVMARRGNREAKLGNEYLRTYKILGLSQVYLDFAGRCPENAPMHRALSEVNAEDSVHMREEDGKIVLAPENGLPVAALSQSVVVVWRDRLNDIKKRRDCQGWPPSRERRTGVCWAATMQRVGGSGG